jgi:hypothetical protein
MERKMNNFDDFMKQIGKICREIEYATGMANDDENIQEYLSECGCWDDSYKLEFNIIDYLMQYYRD